MTNRQLFLQHIAQTSPAPIGLEIVKAEGLYLFDTKGKSYLDLISGFSVMHLGHGQPTVKAAIHQQVEQYMHLMVYGEIIENPQVQFARLLCQHLPSSLNCVYFVNSGSEATEGAMKLAKRVTGRSKIVGFKNAYHGSTQGALSLMGDEYWRQAYRPLLPDIWHADYNHYEALDMVTTQTAAVVVEVMQAEAGAKLADRDWLQLLRKKCTEVGALLIVDEIQTGFGRTGSLWAFETYAIIPDVLLLGKALGGGLPLGAFIASQKLMNSFTANPVLGHISTFAGHPVCCAAGEAAFRLLLQLFLPNSQQYAEDAPAMIASVLQKEQCFRIHLQHPAIVAIHGRGLLLALEFAEASLCQQICHACVAEGFITDWFLFAPNCLRIAPPLIIDNETIRTVCDSLLQVITKILSHRK